MKDQRRRSDCLSWQLAQAAKTSKNKSKAVEDIFKSALKIKPSC